MIVTGVLAGTFSTLHEPHPLTLQQHHLLQHGCWAHPPCPDDLSQMRAIFHQAARRWHPDKVVPKLVGTAEESATALKRIQLLVQSINEEWGCLNVNPGVAADQ